MQKVVKKSAQICKLAFSHLHISHQRNSMHVAGFHSSSVKYCTYFELDMRVWAISYVCVCVCYLSNSTRGSVREVLLQKVVSTPP